MFECTTRGKARQARSCFRGAPMWQVALLLRRGIIPSTAFLTGGIMRGIRYRNESNSYGNVSALIPGN
jgi:hypothetical protein